MVEDLMNEGEVVLLRVVGGSGPKLERGKEGPRHRRRKVLLPCRGPTK